MAQSKVRKQPYNFDAGPLGHIEGLEFYDRTHSSRTKPVLRYFGGLPYALPPVGPYRFRKPRPLPDQYRYGTKVSPGRFTKSAAVCPQAAFPGNAPDESLWDEDCLQLNIYIPTGRRPKRGWPVFFYIHGGFLQLGSPNEDPTALSALLSETAFEAIVVIPGYRLNAFGFLASRELEAETARYGETCGNMGFWDQRLALEWTAKNIGSFGGDESNITVGGYSAGAQSTFQQLAHELYFVPDGQAVIRRAIMWSNGPGVQPRTVHEQQKQFDELLGALGISMSLSAGEKLRRLRAASPKDIVAVQSQLKLSEFRASTDDAFISKDMVANINNGDFARRMKRRGIALMNGECRNEYHVYQLWRTPEPSYEAIYARLCADYPEVVVWKLMEHTCGADKTLPSQFEDWPELFGYLYAKMQVHDTERGFAHALVRGGLVPGKDLLRYRFDWRAKCAKMPKEWGATHTTDMVIWFWGQGLGHGLTDEEKKILKPWNEAFAAFVKGEDVHWGMKTITDMKRLNANGGTGIWTDDRWDEGLEVWDLVNGKCGFGVIKAEL